MAQEEDSEEPSRSDSWTELEEEEDEEDEEDTEPSEEEKDEEITLEKNCYTLVLVSGRARGILAGRKALFCVIITTVSQVAVVTILTVYSPEYYFGDGGWLLPISENMATNAMKMLSVFLTTFQIIQEMQEINAMLRVLVHTPREPLKGRRWWQSLCALVVQYAFALVVLVVAMQLVMSRQRPVECLWITYYVFMTLNFDNMLCKFLLFSTGLGASLNWTFVLKAAETHEDRLQNRCYGRFNDGLTLYTPMTLIFLIVGLAVGFNICPLTAVRYGHVTNEGPPLMMSSYLGLPQGCCPVDASWPVNVSTAGGAAIPVEVSVPCLSMQAQAPVFYWVLWPDRKKPPNSLQIMEGSGGDGTTALMSGSAKTRPCQMRLWLVTHGYNAREVYHHLIDGQEGISLYKSSFAYMQEWVLKGIPWMQRTRIFVTALNPETKALSPHPVSSDILLRELCAPHCRLCKPDGTCIRCEDGFVVDKAYNCEPCAKHCHRCDDAGPEGCDAEQCVKGYGVYRSLADNGRRLYGAPPAFTSTCLACRSGDICSQCDSLEAAQGDVPEILPCQWCSGDYFKRPNGTCAPCNLEHCRDCGSFDSCKACDSGYTVVPGEGTCAACSANCSKCDFAGVGSCDVGNCSKGFALAKSRIGGPVTCTQCAEHCKSCDIGGGGNCDEDQCQEGFVRHPLRGYLWLMEYRCQVCSHHCTKCELPFKCSLGACEAGFGLQGELECSRCAEDNCERCDMSWAQCEKCMKGYGFSELKTCKECPKHCSACDNVDRCAQCEVGFKLQDNGCVACADQCKSCADSPEGFCDEKSCQDGWTTVRTDNSSRAPGEYICRPCHDLKCKRCDDHGPEVCDKPL